MRSTLGRARVTQTVRPRASRGGSLAALITGSPASRHAAKPPSTISVLTPSLRSCAATPALRSWPCAQATTACLPARVLAQSSVLSADRRMDAGNSSAASGRTSMIVGQTGVPIRRASCSTEIALNAGMMRPLSCRTRYFSLSPHGEIAFPMPLFTRSPRMGVNPKRKAPPRRSGPSPSLDRSTTMVELQPQHFLHTLVRHSSSNAV
jgi:hypothetical protein